MNAPRVLVFDSGLGGLTVFAEIAKARPDADFLYAADDARFPYGAMREDELVGRVAKIVGYLIAAHRPDVVVIACNTASTLVLPPLRKTHENVRFVGTVPAIKPAAETSVSGLVSVLATPGTVARDYTKALIRDFAGNCEVELIGAPRLAEIAERRLHGEAIDIEAVRAEIAPAFVERDGRRTDKIVLACTHFPLLTDILTELSPWAVDFIDPAPAIARRVDALLGPPDGAAKPGERLAPAYFTSHREPPPALQKTLRRLGLEASSEALRPLDAAAPRAALGDKKGP